MKKSTSRAIKYASIIICIALAISVILIYKDYKRNHSDALYYLGITAKKEGDCLKGIKLLSMSIEANPKNYGPYMTLGDCFEKLGRFDLAVEEYQLAYKLIENSKDKSESFDRKSIKKKLKKLQKTQKLKQAPK